MRIVDSDKRPKIEAPKIEAPMIEVMRPSAVDDERRERMLRWAFWALFLLATLCALVWKMTSVGIT